MSELHATSVIVQSNNQNKMDQQNEAEKRAKRKVAILLGYAGEGFHGMQLQKDTDLPTIETCLIEAFRKSGAVREENAGDTHKFGFQRCSRTDKGVSAVCQVVSLKMNTIKDPVEAINSHLPQSIRVFDIKRTTKSFNSKTRCDSREYFYIIPTFIFAPTYEESNSDFRMKDDQRSKLVELFNKYVGTYKFHNFTSRKNASDPSCRRFIKEINLSECFQQQDCEFIRIHIIGQSFMLHQIRKMIGYIVMIVRGYVKCEDFECALSDAYMYIAMAPGHALVLAKINYESYNRTYCKDGEREALDWSTTESIRMEFLEKVVVSHIIQLEKQGKTLEWIKKLDAVLAGTSADKRKLESDEEDKVGETIEKKLKTQE